MPGPDKIMLIRHAEKPQPGVPIPAGVDENGNNDPHSLLVRGWQRAGALVAFFSAPTRAGIAVPSVIFGSGVTSDPSVIPMDAQSLRPQETVGPLHDKTGIALRTDVAVGDEAGLIAALKACDGVVLVAWEHKRIPIVAGGFIDNPPEWGERFDAVWVLDRGPDGSYALAILNQDLLAGDEPA